MRYSKTGAKKAAPTTSQWLWIEKKYRHLQNFDSKYFFIDYSLANLHLLVLQQIYITISDFTSAFPSFRTSHLSVSFYWKILTRKTIANQCTLQFGEKKARRILPSSFLHKTFINYIENRMRIRKNSFTLKFWEKWHFYNLCNGQWRKNGIFWQNFCDFVAFKSHLITFFLCFLWDYEHSVI